jgi:prophage antirepressor-like protein
MKKEKLQIVCRKEILGKEINFYGSIETPYFLPSEIANWLSVTNYRQMLKSADLSEDQKGVFLIDTLGGEQEVVFVNEDGLYDTLLSSRKPESKPLKREIKKYLKQIRLTGAAFEQGREDEAVKYYFSQFSDDTKLAMIKELEEKNKEYEQFYNDLLNTQGLMDMNTVGKELNIGEYKLFDFLRNKKIMFYNSDGVNIPYQRFCNENKFYVRKVKCRDGKYRDVPLATNKGLEYIRKIMRKDGYMEVSANA